MNLKVKDHSLRLMKCRLDAEYAAPLTVYSFAYADTRLLNSTVDFQRIWKDAFSFSFERKMCCRHVPKRVTKAHSLLIKCMPLKKFPSTIPRVHKSGNPRLKSQPKSRIVAHVANFSAFD